MESDRVIGVLKQAYNKKEPLLASDETAARLTVGSLFGHSDPAGQA